MTEESLRVLQRRALVPIYSLDVVLSVQQTVATICSLILIIIIKDLKLQLIFHQMDVNNTVINEVTIAVDSNHNNKLP